MARSKAESNLVETLRARGLRKQVAQTLADGAGRVRGGKQAPKAVRSVLDDLKSITSEVEDRLTGGSSKRSEAAKKAARTRKRNATKSTTTKKATGAKRTAKAATSRATNTATSRTKAATGGKAATKSRAKSTRSAKRA